MLLVDRGYKDLVSILIKAGLERIEIPALISYLLLGITTNLLNGQIYFLTPTIIKVYAFLAELGLFSYCSELV